ncbi:MAG: hypothetical protein CMF52_03055 [Legionellales bacterium]|nr:hypothetical protein [Legionellales bacterium]|tara:strand:- start:341 stop:661 length:321 start_codon:yes stop_codon:yes gene_type:complete
MASGNIEKQIKMGLGEAVRRLLDLEIQYRQGRRTEALTAERLLVLEALNRVELDLGFDCNDDGVPDTVEIFKKSASTSCCRIMPTGNKAKSQRAGGSKPRRVRKKK